MLFGLSDIASGGKRQGAGRKPIDPKEKKVQVSISVSPDTKDTIRELREKGYDVNKYIERCIVGLYMRDFENTYKK
jgi:hypothetical protein